MKKIIKTFLISSIALASGLQTKEDVLNSIKTSTEVNVQVTVTAQLDEGSRLSPDYVTSLTGVPFGSYINMDGIPETFTQGSSPDLLYRGYTSIEMIKTTLEEARFEAGSNRLRFLIDQIDEITKISSQKPNEVLTRIVLNRARDIVNHTLPIVGHNTEFIISFYNRFLIESYNMAAMYVNNQVGLESYLTDSNDSENADPSKLVNFIQNVSMATFTYQYAKMLLKYTESLSTDSSKAIMLARLVSYIVWDLNLDLDRRDEGISMTLTDIHLLQRKGVYKRPLMAIAHDSEPTQAQVARLRSEVNKILDRMPRRIEGLTNVKMM